MCREKDLSIEKYIYTHIPCPSHLSEWEDGFHLSWAWGLEAEMQIKETKFRQVS